MLLLGVLCILGVLAFTVRVGREMPDFAVYRTAASRALAGAPLYRAEDGHYQFKYLPAFALAMTPFGLMPSAVAKQVWFGLSVALLLALIVLSLRLLPREPDGLPYPGWIVVAAAVVTLGKFYGRELLLGQTNILMTVVSLLALAQLKARRDAAAGLLFAAAVVVKPYAAIFAPYLILTRRTRATIGFGIALALALLLPAVRYGMEANAALVADWWQTVTASTAPNLTNQDNVSVAGLYARWLGPGPAAERFALATAIVLLGVGLGIALVKASPSTGCPEYLEVSLLLVLVPLLSPQGWDYVLLASTPAVMLLASRAAVEAAFVRWLTITLFATVGLSLYDVMGRAAYGRFMTWSIITFCYFGIIALLVRLRIRRAA